jgi:hypothetical protein
MQLQYKNIVTKVPVVFQYGSGCVLIFYMVIPGGCCMKYLATAESIKEVGNFSSSFSGGMCVDTRKT